MDTACVNFHGPISHPATTKLRNAVCGAVNERIQEGPNKGQKRYDKLYLFMNSVGGPLDDAFALFGFLRVIPIEVTTINTGWIASSSILPFMAGKIRVALPHSRFHFHDYEWNYPAAHNMTRLEYVDHTQILETSKSRTLEILKELTSLTDEDFKSLKFLDVPIIKDATFAKEKGIVHKVEHFVVPEGMNIFNVDY
jgi:ATP-dependent protease ClpP protease subunit